MQAGVGFPAGDLEPPPQRRIAAGVSNPQLQLCSGHIDELLQEEPEHIRPRGARLRLEAPSLLPPADDAAGILLRLIAIDDRVEQQNRLSIHEELDLLDRKASFR